MSASKDYNYTFQLLLLGNAGEHQCDFKGSLDTQLRKLGMDMDKLVTFPVALEFVKLDCPALGIYFGVKATTDNTEDENQRTKDKRMIQELRADGIPVLNFSKSSGVVDKSQKNYSLWVDKVLQCMGLSRRRKVWVNYTDGTPVGLCRALCNVLQTRHYEVCEECYRLGNPSQETSHEALDDSDVLIFFHMFGSSKDSWVQQRLAHAARLQIGVIEVMSENEIPSYGTLGSVVTLDGLWSPCCGCRTMAGRLVDQVDSLWIANQRARMDNLSGTLQEYHRRNIKTDEELLPGYVVSSNLYGRLQYQVPVCATRAESFDDALVQAKTLLPPGTGNDEIELVYDSLCTKHSGRLCQKQLHDYAMVELLDVRRFFRVDPLAGSEKHVLLLASLSSSQKTVADAASLPIIDRLAVRDAIRAFFSLLPSGVCVHLPAHPAMVSLVESIQKWREEILNCMKIYRHPYFVGKDSIDNKGALKKCFVSMDAYIIDEETVWKSMYDYMKNTKTQWDAVVMIGGGATEYSVALDMRSKSLCWLPVAATGGAAKTLCDRHEKSIRVPGMINKTDLKDGKTNMQSLFHDLFQNL